jgi:hypothetical protein
MDASEFVCPECHGCRFRKWALPHPLVLHFVLNPGGAVNELLLGMRIPKVIYFCRDCQRGLANQYVKCPACGGIHSALIWASLDAFGHWAGLFCPSCGARVPCLRNWFSALILAVTLPAWWFPVRAIKDWWVEIEKSRNVKALAKLQWRRGFLARFRERPRTNEIPPRVMRVGLLCSLVISLALLVPCVAAIHAPRGAFLREAGAPAFSLGLLAASFSGGVAVWLAIRERRLANAGLAVAGIVVLSLWWKFVIEPLITP